MAIRKAAQKAQVVERLSSVAPPGEVFVSCVHAVTGPSPWLNSIFEQVPLLGVAVALSRKYYFFTLTNSSVVVNSANRFSNRPGDIVAVFPRDQLPVTRYKRANLWSRFYLQFPESGKPTRLNVHRFWRVDLDQLATAFPAETSQPADSGQAVPGPIPTVPIPPAPPTTAAAPSEPAAGGPAAS